MNKGALAVLDRLMRGYFSLQRCREDITAAFDILATSYRQQGTVLVCGNGGSCADAEHIVGELMNKLSDPRPIAGEDRTAIAQLVGDAALATHIADNLQRALPAISLCSQSALCTAIANDMAADMLFAQQVYGYGRPGDVLIAISTSGNSSNVINAIHVARLRRMKIIGLTGETGGKMRELCDTTIRVPSQTTASCVQELHLPVYHALCGMLEVEFFGMIQE